MYSTIQPTTIDDSPFLAGDADAIDTTKQGHKIFFCCCDSKRAVQIFNAIAILGNILAMTFTAIVNYDPAAFGLTDEQASQFQEVYPFSMMIYGIGLLVNLTVICGASMYNTCLVFFGVLWILVELGYSIYYQTTLPEDQYPIYTIIGTVIWDLLILYPHIVFISEVRSGIMRPETYARERFSCCCV